MSRRIDSRRDAHEAGSSPMNRRVPQLHRARQPFLRCVLCIFIVVACAILACGRSEQGESRGSGLTSQPIGLTREAAVRVAQEAVVSMGWSLQRYDLLGAEENLTGRRGWCVVFMPKAWGRRSAVDGGDFVVFVPVQGEPEIAGKPLSVLKSRSASQPTSTMRRTVCTQATSAR